MRGDRLSMAHTMLDNPQTDEAERGRRAGPSLTFVLRNLSAARSLSICAAPGRFSDLALAQ